MTNKTKEEIKIDRDEAIKQARWIISNDYCVIDTETTGLLNAEMCQLAILHGNGYQYKSLVRPSKLIEPGATAVHHITNTDIEHAPSAVTVAKNIPIRGLVVIYNAPYDTEVIKRSVEARGETFEWLLKVVDAMLIYSTFKGEWDDYHGNYRWQKLGNACVQCKLDIDVNLHDAMSDCIMTDRLIKYMAAQKLSSE